MLGRRPRYWGLSTGHGSAVDGSCELAIVGSGELLAAASQGNNEDLALAEVLQSQNLCTQFKGPALDGRLEGFGKVSCRC